jgi:soluble lytic murein transglycosylase-like protein
MYRWRGLGLAPSATVSTALANASAQTGVPLSLLEQVAQTESSYNPLAVSSAGAQGLMQLMPATASSLGVSNPFDPNQSALGGAQYLEQLYQKYGDWNTALIAYNEGPGNLASQGVFPSSQSYADSILAGANLSTSPVDTASSDDGTDLSSFLSLTDADGSTNWGLIGLAIAGGILLVWAAQ